MTIAAVVAVAVCAVAGAWWMRRRRSRTPPLPPLPEKGGSILDVLSIASQPSLASPAGGTTPIMLSRSHTLSGAIDIPGLPKQVRLLTLKMNRLNGPWSVQRVCVCCFKFELGAHVSCWP